MMGDETEVTVCAECHRACCWQGYFMCDDAKRANVVQLTVGELRALNLEHEKWWER